MTRRISFFLSSLTFALPVSTRETVEIETPASRAMSRIVMFLPISSIVAYLANFCKRFQKIVSAVLLPCSQPFHSPINKQSYA